LSPLLLNSFLVAFLLATKPVYYINRSAAAAAEMWLLTETLGVVCGVIKFHVGAYARIAAHGARVITALLTVGGAGL
jgi:hypothetical protein